MDTAPLVETQDIGEWDVLLGKGGYNHKFIGNQRLRDEAWKRRERHKQAGKKEKTEMSIEILDFIRGGGGRFLKPDSETRMWRDVTEVGDIAREKVAQCLRDAAKGKNAPMEEDDDTPLIYPGAPEMLNEFGAAFYPVHSN